MFGFLPTPSTPPTKQQHFQKHSIRLAPFLPTPTLQSINDAAQTLGLPLMLKSRKGAYDGRGNTVLNDTTPQAIQQALTSLGCAPQPGSPPPTNLDLYAEGWCRFDSEIAVMVIRFTNGEVRSYPPVTVVQTNSICRVVLAPARGVKNDVVERCGDLARRAVE